MGIFDKVKNAVSGTDLDYWKVLDEESQVEEVLKASYERAQLVYKHSHRCSICFIAKQNIEEKSDAISEQADMYFVNVVKSRPVSNSLTEKLGVRHESPQALLIRNGDVIWYASHHSIKGKAIIDALNDS